MNVMVKVFAIIFAVLCVMAAVIQYNDPDPLVWVVIYSIAALFSIAFVFNKLSYVWYLLFGITAIIYGWFQFPDQFQGFSVEGGDINDIERGREAIGLFILGLVQLFYAAWKRFWTK